MAAKLRALSAAVGTSLLLAAPAHAALSAPAPTSPASAAAVSSLPAFAWAPVAGADRYEFQFAADPGFNSPVLGADQDHYFTRNTRATLKKTVPNGTYWWRVRAVTADGDVSSWSTGRSLVKSWSAAATLQSPSGGASLSFPGSGLALLWSPVAGAASYRVSVATDPQLGSLVVHDDYSATQPPKVAANSIAIGGALAPGTYYWSITPVDAEGNQGLPSPVASFNWLWPSATTPQIEDLNDASEVYDPKFSWDLVPGAARYEVEVNSSVDFAPGSKVCCSGTTIATSLAPTTLFKDNVYYWRVRALDPDGNAGVWNYGPSFTKTFDNVPPVTSPAIKNLRLRGYLSDAPNDEDTGTAGYQTTVPIVVWDRVPGASSYQVQVAPYGTTPSDPVPACRYASPTQTVKTAVPAWTPLGPLTSANPVPSATAAMDFDTVTPGKYCVRVQARSDRVGYEEVYGDWTELTPDPAVEWGFEWTGYPTGGSCSPSCNSGYLGAGDYVEPKGTTARRTPLFTWKPLAGKQSYFVVVAKDASFSNIVDEAFTRVPAYAPRGSFDPTTYSDETTDYFWAVLPASSVDGSDAVADLAKAAKQSFQKQSTPPTLLAPANGTAFYSQPTFRWTPAEGARYYRLQVSQDPTFGSPIDDVTTDSTAYSSNTTYPADTVLYWRVRAADENEVGLTWSATGTFQKKLAAPVPSASNPSSGEFLPVWSWGSVDGAVSYDLSLDQPDGQHRDFTGFRMPAVSFQKMTGTGVWHWKVRAEFPKQTYGTTPGPWSPMVAFTRTIGEPTGVRTDGAPDHLLLSWNPKIYIKNYKLQIAARPDFAYAIEDVTTDNTSYAPRLTDIAYLNGGPLWWRVAGVDEDGNVGDFTAPQSISLLPQLKLRATGKLRRRRWARVTVYVSNASGQGLAGVAVRVLGSGVKKQTHATNTFGYTSFRLRPTKKGRVLFRAAKSGYQAAERVLLVR